MELTIQKVALVEATVKNKVTSTSLLPVHEITDELDLVIVPRLSALSMLLVILPFAFVHASVHIDEYTVAFSFSVLPLSLIDVTVCVSHAALAIEQAVLRLSMIR